MNTPDSNPPASLRGTLAHVFAAHTLGITARTALFSWLIAIVTLLLFVVAILPQQKDTFVTTLRSKALGVAVALRDVTSSAVVNEDYSSVVDHCVEIIRGDPAIDYIVITRNDGFSLIHDHTGWRSETLSTDWHPAQRIPFGNIRTVSLFDRRVYAFSQPFSYSGIEWGWIHVGLTLDSYDRNLRSLYRRTALLVVICVGFGFLASVGYAKLLVRPIVSLQQVVQRVARGDLSARAPIDRLDELGRLAAAFNSMAEALLRRDRHLQEINETLEHRVRERTRELESQVAARERTNRELADAQRRLMQLSREAGMAEVATGVLHNVGNVLNSVNVSAVLLRDTLRTSELPQLDRTLALLEHHHADLARFLTTDPRGRLVLPFLRQLATQLETERSRLTTEADGLSHNVEHIKEIVAMQQTFARTAAILEQLSPVDLIEHALSINQGSLSRHDCIVHRTFAPDLPPLTTDRHNVVQILTNFVTNAIHAAKANPRDNRHITVAIERHGPDRLAFRVTDNGVGIAADHLPRIFSLGFTTRKDGHGFGLHAGALAARALGGKLEVASPGPGAGATFTLLLPVSRAAAAS